MSAVSSDPPRPDADLTTSADYRRRYDQSKTLGAPDGQQSHEPAADADFGPNEWLVDELYQRYLNDPQTVDKAWWNFFADYEPEAATGLGRAWVTRPPRLPTSHLASGSRCAGTRSGTEPASAPCGWPGTAAGRNGCAARAARAARGQSPPPELGSAPRQRHRRYPRTRRRSGSAARRPAPR